jgi:hypothetical protein
VSSLLTADEERDFRDEVNATLDQQAVVYGEDETTGRYTVVLNLALKCRVNPVNLQAPASGGARVELMGVRDFLWVADYDMPENVQLLVDGIRYQAEAGTYQRIRAGDSGVLFRRCSVTRQQVGAF